ncbi:hypothetical protein [Actinotalea sp. K2]|uniref:hypothetical protein n=1 Tax=Actinotalea sp. K2 TaxID=2939438 RepID=UPI002017E766|nr:hypothetical protein [Actinotalea sp. K2]MCL3859922.1 hypothetical protein [Actinotalea sp. K2]
MSTTLAQVRTPTDPEAPLVHVHCKPARCVSQLGRVISGGAVALSAVLLLAACTTDPASPSDGPLVPGPAPDGWEAVDYGTVTVHVPAGFEPVDGASADPAHPDAESFALLGPANDEGRTPGVTTTVAPDPDRTASVEVDALENQWSATRGVEDFARSQVSWPGAESAVFLAFESEATDSSGTSVPYRYEWFVADLEDGSQVLVGSVAPVADFDELQMHEVLSSLELAP